MWSEIESTEIIKAVALNVGHGSLSQLSTHEDITMPRFSTLDSVRAIKQVEASDSHRSVGMTLAVIYSSNDNHQLSVMIISRHQPGCRFTSKGKFKDE